MPARKKSSSSKPATTDLWLAPKSNLKSEPRYGLWRDVNNAPSSRLLELADIALGFRKPVPPQKRRFALGKTLEIQ